MADSIHKTKGIVLRTVPFGETSLIVSIYTELFGLQSYMVNRVRTSSRKGGGKLLFFQPATILEMEVYHHPFKRLNRIREYRLAFPQDEVQTHILKNSVAMYMIELLGRSVKEPEANSDLFAFIEDCLQHLNDCSREVMANFPVFFALQLSHFFGFYPDSGQNGILNPLPAGFDIREQMSKTDMLAQTHYLEPQAALVLAEIAKAQHPVELAEIQTNRDTRRKILEFLEGYYNQHLPGFGKLKTLRVLAEIW